MIADAKSSATISLDPNCRPNLVTDKTAYLSRMSAFIDSADIVRMSDVDFSYLYGDEDYAAKAEQLLGRGCSLFVITRGIKGAQAWHPAAGAVEVAAPAVKVEDTIGAGDSFQAALLYSLHRLGRLGRSALKDISADELRYALSFASNCAALTCTRIGANPPRINEVVWTW